ncbi:MAG: hypothetical protein CMO61_11760 [Verrucomicrobiales bacterium]|nr:hypothetical protein [Verrucomicrobiales bacterium]
MAEIPPEMDLFSRKKVTLDLFEDSNNQKSLTMFRLSLPLAALSAGFFRNPTDPEMLFVDPDQFVPIVRMEVPATSKTTPRCQGRMRRNFPLTSSKIVWQSEIIRFIGR